MRKLYFVLLTVVIILCFGGYKVNDYIMKIQNNDSKPIHSNPDLIQNDNKDTTNKDINVSTLEEKLFKEKNKKVDVKIKYPQIKSDNNFNTEKINKIIEEVTIKKYWDEWDWIYESNSDDYSVKLSLDQTYKASLHNDDILSIVFNQYTYVSGSPYPNTNCYSVNINLKTAEVLSLSNFIKSYEYLENKIKSGEYEILHGSSDTLSVDRILEVINNNFENTKFNENKDNFYILNDGSVCIIIELIHAEGGYSIIKINK